MPLKIQQTNSLLTSQSGLALVGALLQQTQYSEKLALLPHPANRGRTHLSSDIAKAMIGLLVQGKCDFEDIEGHRNDSFFPLALNLSQVPSTAALRQRLDLADERWDSVAVETAVKLLAHYAIQTPCYQDYIPLDADVSPMENSNSNKEGVSMTYKKVMGYAPIFVYLGAEGYLLNLEFREGKQHCQAGTTEFLTQSFQLLPQLKHAKYLLRMDAGNDCVDNQIACEHFNKAHQSRIRIDYIIKRNQRRESAEKWLEIAQQHGKSQRARPGKNVWLGKISRQYKQLDEPVTIIFRVTQRTVSATGQQLLLPEIEVESWVTSLNESPEQIIELYQDHGTSEQFHSEFKTDIGLE